MVDLFLIQLLGLGHNTVHLNHVFTPYCKYSQLKKQISKSEIRSK